MNARVDSGSPRVSDGDGSGIYDGRNDYGDINNDHGNMVCDGDDDDHALLYGGGLEYADGVMTVMIHLMMMML